ncbi:Small G protein signaling modulator 3 like [Pseudolycoriella hygida]|uniref:Small G protein signaling modulator 3 like n=1 Tax=Pseudolycoriella hygida TaxID=35572 RepID=A0A9Q0RWE1_9DIPT|nr:Small G protein signaling modulator 3 like [Pseudolycoriella hygida]
MKSQKYEHCWIGELNGLRGWFPAKFVELLDERSKLYTSAGGDAISETVTDLVRGTLAPAIKQVLEHGMKRPSFLGGPCHPMAPTCIFLASKVEEFGVISNSRLISTVTIGICSGIQKQVPLCISTRMHIPYESHLGMRILSIGKSRLMSDCVSTDKHFVFHRFSFNLSDFSSLTSYRVILQKDVKSWFAEINVNIEKIQEISKTILGLYELWRTYDEKKEIQDLLSKMPKPRPPPQQQQQQQNQQNQQTQNPQQPSIN